jgi:PAS domain-containing protein
MHVLARLRGQLARLRAHPAKHDATALDLADEALQLIDTLRIESAELHRRCATLEQQLESADAQAHSLMNAVPVAMITTDGRGTITSTNAAAVGLLGRSGPRLRDELLLYFFDDRAGFSDVLRSLPQGTAPLHVTLRLRPRERAPFDAALTVVRDPRDEDGRWLWFVSPLSGRQRATSMNGRLAEEGATCHPAAS